MPETQAASKTWKIVLAYDGTDFRGWQIQPGVGTIQGSLAHAIEQVTGERMLPQGSGRTDAGVHAAAQVASFALVAAIPPANLQRALNRKLPESIRVLSAEIVSDDFHARHSAISKRYEYRIFRGEICPPSLARFVFALNWPLEVEAMNLAAAVVVGEHDFTSFAANDPELSQRRTGGDESPDCTRTITESAWHQQEDLLIYRVAGSGFLHHMVRNLVGTFLEVGRGRLGPESIAAILAARSRSAAGPTAPARGLFLMEVKYSEPGYPAVLP